VEVVVSGWWHPSATEDEEFGPGAALVLSLFAVFMLVAALAWKDAQRRGAALPTTLVNIAEGSGGDGFFEVGKARLTTAAASTIDGVARRAVERARTERQQGLRGLNHLQVIGYASPEGRGNQPLAAARAIAVRDYLVDQLGVPDDCVVVATYADSHSRVLRAWERKGHRLADFKRLATAEEQRRALDVPDDELRQERRVTILGVYHSDSTCRLDQVALKCGAATVP
jgi:outer membrane protein OmpA-like peptidoglycan-associated protein